MTKKLNQQGKELNKKANIKVATCSVDWDQKTITKDASGNIFVEGFANTSDKDRVNDVILPSAFADTIKEFMENPIMLYQHDWDKVIGNFVEIKIVDGQENSTNGLWVKGKISNAKDVEDVKTKIREGSLKTFSIGYNELDSDYDKATETNIVTKLELLEISIVTIPCNPFAKFSTTEQEQKTSSEGITKEALEFLSDAIKQLKDIGEVTPDFLQELISIYTETKNNK